MGKAKRNKISKRVNARSNPTGVVDDDTEVSEPSPAVILLQKLSSPSAEERQCSCLTLANMVLDGESASLLLDADIVRLLGPLLVDSVSSVREAAAGALRNLSLSSNEKACEQMIAADVMTPLTALFKEAHAELKTCLLSDCTAAAAQSKDQKADLDRLVSSVEQTLHLFLNLAEASPIALEVFNREGLVLPVIECLQVPTFPESIVLVAAQCLQTVSENNSAVSSLILSTPVVLDGLTQLVKSLPPSESTIGLLVMLAGTLSNLIAEASSNVQEALLSMIFLVLSAALEADAHTALANVSSSFVGASEDSLGDNTEVKQIKSILSAQQIALEVLTNVCNIEDGNDDDDDEWEDAAGENDEDEAIAEEMEDVAEEAAAANGGTSPSLARLVGDGLVSCQCVSKIYSKCEGLPSHIVQIISCSESGRSLMKQSETVQCRALVALQALSSCVPVGAIGDSADLLRLWSMLYTAVNQLGISSDLHEALTGTMRTTATLLKQSEAPCSFVEHIDSLCAASQLPHVSVDSRVNLLATLNVLGSMLVKVSGSAAALSVMGKCFVSAAAESSSVRVACEALDGVFDVYADGGEEGDAALDQSGMIPALQQLAPALKSKLRQGRRSLGREYPLLQSAHLNLVRFIKYKKKRAT